jgi:polyphenol oxidase
VYHWRASVGPVDLAFTDRYGGASGAPFDELNLALEGRDDPETCAANLRLVAADFAPGAAVVDMRQVHGSVVDVVEDRRTIARPEADALVTAEPGNVLVVRVADCVPLLLADPAAGVVAAVHVGRNGMLVGAAPAAVARMRDLEVAAWIGPHICGACYEVPAAMQAEVGAVVPEAVATTSWGTPSLDIGAGVRAQLEALDVTVTEVGTCTRESEDLYSHRRDGPRAGRFAGLVRRRG